MKSDPEAIRRLTFPFKSGMLYPESNNKKGNDFSFPFVTPKRFERLTYCLEGSCSIQLSYGVVVLY
jgi:hypothetical protein